MTVGEISTEIWRRLVTGQSLVDLHLPLRDGRVLLSGLRAPAPEVVRRFSVNQQPVGELDRVIVIEGVRWSNLDFTRSSLDHLRFVDCEIERCTFDASSCRDWRLWATRIASTSFRLADLRGSQLGAVYEGRQNNFLTVDFTRADLRHTVHHAAVFVACVFSNANLRKVDFSGDSFTDCSFEGLLDEVCFNRHGFKGEGLRPNEMVNVDFSRAEFRLVEFRELNLARVRFPADDEHIIVDRYADALDRAISVLHIKKELRWRQMTALLIHMRKWAGPNQQRGVISKRDIRETIGEEGLREFEEILASILREQMSLRD